MPRNILQRRFTLRDAVVLVSLAKQELRARLVRIGVEHEAAGRAELSLPSGEGPAGDDARQRRHIVLGVAAADAERMQFHDLAREILVQPALAVLPGAGVRGERVVIVEKAKHRRMLLNRLEHLTEASEHVGPDCLALERASPDPRQFALVGGNAKMVGPEHHQPLGESAIGEHRALQARQRFRAEGFLMMLSGGCGGFGVLGCIVALGCVASAGGMAALALPFSMPGAFADISVTLLSERLRRCALVSSAGGAGLRS